MDDLRGALHDAADGTANPDVESLVTGAGRRVAATRRRRLGALSVATAALVVVGGVVAGTLSTNQALPQPAGPGPSSVKAAVVDHAPSSARPTPSSAPTSECDKTSGKKDSVVMVNWVDFVQLNGTQFVAEYGPGHPIASAQMGAVVGRVLCQFSALKLSEMPGPIVDGDAAFLPIGTEVHSILGFDPSCRVAARFEGINRGYLAYHDVDGSSLPVPCAKAP
jgi:hypothetical protein